VQEGRAGLLRTLRFAPQITRRLGFADQAREVTFAVLGDTGDSPTFLRALRLAASHGADFLLLPATSSISTPRSPTFGTSWPAHRCHLHCSSPTLTVDGYMETDEIYSF